jgi:arabinan endo-1,5-alpha-L-arabinosidase
MVPPWKASPLLGGLAAAGLLLIASACPAPGADWALTGSLGAHDPSIIEEGSTWWVFSTGAGLPVKHSADGLNWVQGAPLFASELPWWRTYAPTMGLLDVWAPDVHRFAGRYWCYYCVSEFGTNNSAIGLTSCTSIALGDWRDDGLVISSENGANAYNALDPDLAIDASGNPWLVFGSWFDGIHVVKLDPATMKPAGTIYSIAERANGIEASNILYNNGYYYLFVSIDKCCLGVDSTYKIAYGRSTSITGPYGDKGNAAMLDAGGTVLDSGGPRWVGPGGQSVYHDNSGGWIIAFHAYDALNNGDPTLMISDLYWDSGNWPTFTGAGPPASPVFTTQPIPATVTGGTVALDAVATNSPAYQWMLNGAAVPGATGPILLIGNAAAAAGTYTCVATNSSGSATSSAATIGLTSTADIGRLTNISCRAGVGTGGNILIAGFVVGGAGTSGQESLLVRASGPALVPFGVAGTLPDPQLQVLSGSTVLATDSGWAGNAQVASAAASVGAFAWTSPASHDSALLETLSPGAYTAQIAGQVGDTGVALAELYDATAAGTYTPATPRLVNISTRAQVGTGGTILIAGFVIGGSTSRTVLIRASGPALAPFGIAGTLPDPQLKLFSGSAVIESDNGWAGNPQISATAASVGAFAWNNPMSGDSAILVALPPGAYTAQVSGASGDTGVALIEVYEVP